jgi:hypothetical protein
VVFLATAIALVVMVSIMISHGISVAQIDQSGDEKLPKVYLCFKQACTCLEAYQVTASSL